MPGNQESSQSSESSQGTEMNPDINLESKENSLYQGVISESYQRPDKTFFEESCELQNLINTSNLVQTFLPKQTDIDRILKYLQRKVLKGTHLPVKVKEIKAGYISSSYLKDIYLYLAQNELPSRKSVIRKVETLAEWCILLDSLLFRISATPEKETALLAIPETCADKIITLYHASLFAGHQDIIKTYLTNDTFFIPNLIHYIWSYIKGCHICQLAHNERPPTRQLQTRINPNYMPLSRLSRDMKVMLR